MPKTVIIGAGSGFGRRLTIDILAFPELQEGELVMVDIDPVGLGPVTDFARQVVKAHHAPTQVGSSLHRREVLEGADYVVVAIAVGGPSYAGRPFYDEIEIPRRYGVDQSVGDTLGPGGVFRALRTAPEMLAIGRDMEELCPQALLINYTNPMAMLCWAMNAATRIRNVGLCHSVQGTSMDLARYIGAPYEEIGAWVAGINHIAWFLRFERNGQDAYPALREAMADPDLFARDAVRFEVFKHFGYFVTESSGHMSEYVPWFRKRADLRDQFHLPSRRPPQDGRQRAWWWQDENTRKQLAGEVPINLAPSHEYAAHIMHAIETDEPFRFNGNVRNGGAIANLPADCCVEVPCVVDKTGVHPCVVGELPTALAAMNLSNVAVQSLTVQAILEGCREKAIQAVLLDPLTAAVCSLAEARAMGKELFAADAEWLGYLR